MKTMNTSMKTYTITEFELNEIINAVRCAKRSCNDIIYRDKPYKEFKAIHFKMLLDKLLSWRGK